MMGIYFLWRLSMLVVTVLVFSVFVSFYNLVNKILHRGNGKESEQ